MVDGQPQVFLAALSAKTALLKDSDGLRDKHLLDFDPGQVTAVRSSIGKGFQIERDKKGDWQVHQGAEVEPVEHDQFKAWLGQLKDVKGDSVAEEQVKSPGKYGLGSAQLELDFGRQVPLVLQKGGLQGKGPAFFGRLKGQTQAWVLPGTAAATLAREGRSLMDLKAFSFQPGMVQHLSFWQAGNTVNAHRKDTKWTWDPPFKAKAGSKPFDFDDFVVKASGAERLGRLPDSARPAKPQLVVTFYGDGDNFLDEAFVGPKQGQGQVAVSAVKKMVMLVAGNVFDGVPPPQEK